MSPRERSWPVPVALIALSIVPLTAGTLRLVELAGGPAVLPANDRFASFPLPLVLHLVGATIYALVGILQFVPRFRRRHLVWHRRAGRVLAVAGLLVAISALWMTLFFKHSPTAATCSTCSACWSDPRWPCSSCSASPPYVVATSRPTAPG